MSRQVHTTAWVSFLASADSAFYIHIQSHNRSGLSSRKGCFVLSNNHLKHSRKNGKWARHICAALVCSASWSSLPLRLWVDGVLQTASYSGKQLCKCWLFCNQQREMPLIFHESANHYLQSRHYVKNRVGVKMLELRRKGKDGVLQK